MASFKGVCEPATFINMARFGVKGDFSMGDEQARFFFERLCTIMRRLIRTNLSESDVEPLKENLAQALFDHIPVGVGSQGGARSWHLYAAVG